MAGNDVQRLLLQVDASVELARRNMRELAAAVDRDATSMDMALGRVEKAHSRMGRQLAMTGQFRGGMQQLSFQIGDVASQMALGTKASVIFAQQSGQVIQALQLMGGQGNAFLRFLSGPWGIALSTATVIFTTFAGKLFTGGNAIDSLVAKMREQARQAQLNKQADEAWRQTIEGVTEAIRKRREEQEKSLRTEIQTEQKALRDAQDELSDQRDNQAKIERALTAARRDLTDRQRAAAEVRGTQIGGPAEASVRDAENKVRALETKLAEVKASIAEAEAGVRGAEIVIGERRVEAQLDKVKAATDEYTRALGRLREERKKGLISQAEFDRQLTVEKQKLKTAEEAAREAAKKDDKPGQVISDLQRAEFFTAASAFTGLTETGGKSQLMALFREANVNVDPEMVAWCAAFVNAVLATKGVQGTGSLAARSFLNFGEGTNDPKKGDIVVLKRGNDPNQGHVGFFEGFDSKGNVRVLGGNQGDKVGTATFSKNDVLGFRRAPSPASAADLAAKAADRARNQDDAFRSAMAQLEAQLLAGQAELVEGIEAQAEFAMKMVDAEQKRFEQAVQNDINDGRIREEQGQLLIEKSRAVAQQRKANIEARKDLEQLEEANRDLAQAREFQIEDLRYREEIARTAAEQRRIQLDIIDLLYAQKEADLKIAKAKAEAAQKWEEAARIQRAIDELPAQRARDEDQARRGTMSPLERWADGVPQTAAEMNEALEELTVQGIEGAIDALMALSEGWESARDVALNAIKAILAELIRLQLMKLALNLFGGAGGLGGGAGAITGGGTGALSFAGTALSVVPSGSGWLGVLPGAASGMVGTIGGRGGVDQNVLSINGRAALRVSRGETLAVIPQAPNVAIPRPANQNAPRGAGGDTTLNAAFHFHGPVRDGQRTGLQAAGAMKREVARAAKRGS